MDEATRIQRLEDAMIEQQHFTRKLNKDMYYGNGKPGITTRMQVNEDKVTDLRTYAAFTATTSIMTFLAVLGWMAAQLWGHR